MLDIIGWFTAGLSLTGNWFVIKKHWIGFGIWIIANTIWIYIDISINIYSQAGLFCAYNVLAVWGILRWFKEAKVKEGVGLCWFSEPSHCALCKHSCKGNVGPECVKENRIQVRYDEMYNKVKIVCVAKEVA